VRTLVAVGTLMEASMFAARALGMPLRMVTESSVSRSTLGTLAAGACAGMGAV
jgi:hypothetical protein